jgi:hypothetical protein
MGWAIVRISACLLLLAVGSPAWADPRAEAPETRAPARARLSEAYGKLPLNFEANRGQSDPRVRFLARSPGYTLFLTPAEAVLVLTRPGSQGPGERESRLTEDGVRVGGAVLRLAFVGANPTPRVAGLEDLPGKANYFLGKDPARWRTQVPTYAKVEYRDLYPGVDLVYYGHRGQLEYDLVLQPGADPARIVLAIQGADRLDVDGQGDLVLHTAGGAVRQRKPVIYQDVDGVRRQIAGGYVLKAAHQVAFQVGVYDASRPLVIDPVLVYSTYLGGSQTHEHGLGIAVDSSGNAYVTGSVSFGHTSANFPTTAGAFQPAFGGSTDAFVTKLDPTGSRLVYSTYLGGSGSDVGASIAADAAGNAFVTGRTSSTNFPTTVGALQPSFGGGWADAFVVKLDPTGSALVYSTYLGGGGGPDPVGGELPGDWGAGIAVDASSNAYVVGSTSSANFPTANAVQPASGGFHDAFVVKLDPTGSALAYSTYLGGSSRDVGVGIAVDPAGNAYVIGSTLSADFPTANAVQPASGGFDDAFVAKLDPTGSALAYSTYLGGSEGEAGKAIAVDPSGNAYVTGWTQSTDFPTAHPLRPVNGGAGVFGSTNGGDRWAGLGLNNLSVSALVVDPTRPLVVYAGTWGDPVAAGTTSDDALYTEASTGGDGVFKSADGGASWAAVNAGLSVLDVRALAIDPKTPATLYVGTQGGGVFKSTDGGESWVPSSGTGPEVHSLAVDPMNPSILYAGTSREIFKSVDAGATWIRLELSPSAVALAIDPVMPSTVYAAVPSGGVSKSTDGGVTWTPVNMGLESGHPAFRHWPVLALVIDPVNTLTLYAGTYVGVYKSVNGGASWTSASRGLGAGTVSALAIAPPTNGLPTDPPILSTVYAGTSQSGAFRSTDGGGTWTAVNTELTNEFVVSLAVDRTTPSVVYAGSRGHSKDAFVAKLDATGSALAYSTYLGGWHDDRGLGIAVGSSGHALVTGSTKSSDFPVANAVQPTFTGGRDHVGSAVADAFLTKVDPSGSSLVSSTYVGGGGYDAGHAVATDAAGDAYVTGVTNSFDFPTANPAQPALGAFGECCWTYDAFVLKIADTGP